MSANITDITVEYTTGLHESCFQEPAIVFFTAWVILQAMPEGHWSLSTLPGNGLLVRMGLEGSLRFLCVPLLKESYVELVWTWASTMIHPWSHSSGVIFIVVCSSLLPSWLAFSLCVCEISKCHNFITQCLLWRLLTLPPVYGWII